MASATEAPATTQAEGPTQHTQNQALHTPANTYGYTREEQLAALAKLREPFPASEIRFMPRVWCRACKNSARGCTDHPVEKCSKCKQKMPRGGHIDLSYVGHAEATNRLLNVDPFWDWEPLTVDERGLPHVDGYRGLWIRLTVCGMTRLGYGHAGDKTGGDAVKEVIGDAIRNAGMRFGMALDLWTTSDLERVESDTSAPEEPAPNGQGHAELDRLVAQAQNPGCWDNPLALTQIRIAAKEADVGDRLVEGPDGQWQAFDAILTARIDALNAAKTGDNRTEGAA